MYPLEDTALTLTRIAQHWARDLVQRPPQTEVLDDLLHAYWRGDFDMYVRPKGGIRCRRKMLAMCRELTDHPRILFYGPNEAVPLKFEPADDGDVLYDIRRHILLAADSSIWSDDDLARACNELAELRLGDFSAIVAPFFSTMTLAKDQFRAWCLAHNRELPAFWFAIESAKSRKLDLIRLAKARIRELTASGKRRSRNECRQVLKAEMPDLLDAWFNVAWADTAPPGGRKPGAIPKD